MLRRHREKQRAAQTPQSTPKTPLADDFPKREQLATQGYEHYEDFRGVRLEELTVIKGIGPSKASEILGLVDGYMLAKGISNGVPDSSPT